MQISGASAWCYFVCDQFPKRRPSHSAGKVSQNRTVGNWVVLKRGPSGPKRRRPLNRHRCRRETPLIQPCNTLNLWQASTVAQYVPNGDSALPVLRELWPVVGNWRLIVDRTSLHEAMDQRCGDSLRAREHQEKRVLFYSAPGQRIRNADRCVRDPLAAVVGGNLESNLAEPI